MSKKSINKTTFAKVLEVNHGMSASQAMAAADELIKLIKVTLIGGGKVNLLNVGVLEGRLCSATRLKSFGKDITMPAHVRVRFKVSNNFKSEAKDKVSKAGGRRADPVMGRILKKFVK